MGCSRRGINQGLRGTMGEDVRRYHAEQDVGTEEEALVSGEIVIDGETTLVVEPGFIFDLRG